MVQFNNTYCSKFIDWDEYLRIYNEKDEWIRKLNSCDMIGWMREIDSNLVLKIKDTAQMIKSQFDCMVVIGIGGSFLGSYSFHKMFQKYFDDSSYEVIYAGTTLSSEYIEELLQYLDNKNFCINVISKSGNTMETSIVYSLLKDLLKRKYNDEFRNHIIVTTDKNCGKLREEVIKMGYISFDIDKDIGGRYSFITPSHLLPLSLNQDIDRIIDGYYDGKRTIDLAFSYAICRYLLYKSGKVVENFCIDEEKLYPFSEWLKQLFGESEGKDGKGILPVSSLYTRDLHSLGQFIQDGNKILFETFIRISNGNYYIRYHDKNLEEINQLVIDSVISAHTSGDVPCLEIVIDKLSIENIASLIYFFQLTSAFSSLLMGVNPFNQPGVEVYKQEVRERVGEL